MNVVWLVWSSRSLCYFFLLLVAVRLVYIFRNKWKKLNRNQVLQILRSYNILQLFCCSVVFLPHEGDVERPLAAFGC
uniref:Uncharacterized protein n=1 Tax=Physcomitrium patens TaxID=3218 RepID=A0A2K1JYH3_PHYPA|nr:hypothetical protein PHYPA_013697 [Physcomitrium patens]